MSEELRCEFSDGRWSDHLTAPCGCRVVWKKKDEPTLNYAYQAIEFCPTHRAENDSKQRVKELEGLLNRLIHAAGDVIFDINAHWRVQPHKKTQLVEARYDALAALREGE
jgi:hypothetical protein